MAKNKNRPEKAPENIKPNPSPAPVQAAKSQPAPPATPVKDFFTENAKMVPALALGLLVLGVIVVFREFLFFEKTYFFKDIGSDSLNYSFPEMTHIADYIAKYGLPKWSFAMGMGQSAFPFMLRDPFDIFYYMAGKDSITYGIIFKEVFKLVAAGAVFYCYLRKVNISPFTSVIGSLCFTFSGFMILGSGWYLFTSEGLFLAMFLLSFEQILDDGTWVLFPITVALVGISQPFNLYLLGIFLVIYAVLRLVQTDKLNVKEGGGAFLKMAIFGAVGLLIAGPFLLENVVQLLESPRGGGAFSLSARLKAVPMFDPAGKAELGSGILRFFSTDILGGGREFKGWHNLLEAPMPYVGIISLVLMPQVFSFLDKRRKIAFGIFFGFWILPVLFPYFRHAFWLFSGDYYRMFSFFVGLVFMYFALTALDLIIQHRKINLLSLALTIVFLLVLLNFPYFEEGGVADSGQVGLASILILSYGAIAFFITKRSDITYLKYGLVALVFVELMLMSRMLMNDREALTPEDLQNRISYNDYSNEAVAFIKKQDKSAFYRIDKNYCSSPAMHGSINDGMVQGYYGTSAYSSFNQENYIKYLTLLGVVESGDETSSRWAMGFVRRTLLESQNSVKYILTKGYSFPMWHALCDSLTTTGNIIVLRNKFALPLGYTHEKYIKESVFSQLTLSQRDFIGLDACVIKDEDVKKCSGLKEFQLKDTLAANMFNPEIYGQKVALLRRDTLTIDKFSETNIKGHINLAEERMMYLSIPLDPGWKATVDGKDQEKLTLSAGLTGLMLPKGNHTVEMKYELRYFQKGVYMSIAGLLLFAGLFFVVKKKKPAVA